MNRLPINPAARRVVTAVTLAALMGLAHVAATWLQLNDVSLWYPPAAVSLVALTYFGWRWAPLLVAAAVVTVLWVTTPDADFLRVLISRSASITAYTLAAEVLRSRRWGAQKFNTLVPLWLTAFLAPALATMGIIGTIALFDAVPNRELLVRGMDIYVGDTTALFSLSPLLMTIPYKLHRYDRDIRRWGYVMSGIAAAWAAMAAIMGWIAPVFLLVMAIVAVAATNVSNLQAALIIAAPAVLINASIALSTMASDQIRLAQALIIALSLVVSAVHGLSRDARHTRHTAERKEQRYADVFDTLTEGVLVLDSNGRVLQSNSALRHMFQLDAAVGIEEVLRFGSVEMTDRYGQPISGDEVLLALSNETAAAEDLVLGVDAADGTRIWVSVVARLLAPTGSRTDARLVVTFTDVTAQVGRRSADDVERAQLRRQALYDGLTGLPNRTLLMDRLSQANENASRRQVATGVIVIDLDGFKAVNDGLGHTAGDEILVQVGVRLKSALRSVDTVARLGGDEFVALCENLAVEDAEEQLATIVKRIRGMFDGSFMTSLGPATLGASIGWALVGPGADVDLTMVGTADQAMLDDKWSRRNLSRSGRDHADGKYSHVAAGPETVSVVIVDDDPAMRLLAMRIIGSRRDTLRVVGQAADGQAAIQLITRSRPDVVLCDIRMPGLSGFDVVNAVRADIPEQQFMFWSVVPEHELEKIRHNSGVPTLSKDLIDELPSALLELTSSSASA